MTIEVEKQKPVVDAEKKITDAAPTAVRPEVEQIEREFNEAVDSAASKASEAESEAAKHDPALEQAARDAVAAGHGEVLPLTHVLGDAGAVVKEVRRGYKTTEFWLSAAVIVLAQVGALHLPGHYGATIATAAAAASYAISRGLAK